MQDKNTNIEETLDLLQDYVSMKKDLEEEISKLQAIVKEFLKSENTDTYYGEHDRKVSYREVLSNRFDSTSFKKEYGELYSNFSKPVRSFKFVFTY